MAALAIAVVLAMAGCTSPTPAPTATPVPSPSPTGLPINDTVQMRYNYVDQLQRGMSHYNTGIGYAHQGESLFNSSNYLNASLYMSMAQESMDLAGNDFGNSMQYAQTPDESNLSGLWIAVARYSSEGYINASYAYQEMQNQSGKQPPNLVIFNAFVAQANDNILKSGQYKAQAEALQPNIGFG